MATSREARNNVQSVQHVQTTEANPVHLGQPAEPITTYVPGPVRGSFRRAKKRRNSLFPLIQEETLLAVQNDFTTPTKTSIRKLKAFFGEKTPRIVEATTDRTRVFNMPVGGPSEIVKEGTLCCKLSVMDGKRASDRSWRPLWGLLCGHALFLFKDKSSVNTSPTASDEQPISVKSSIVDIAYDYTKKKHVFRLTTYNGSKYLFQAEDQEDMLDWIKAIQANCNSDDDEKGGANQDVKIRKTSAYEQAISKNSPQLLQKSVKKTSTKPLRSKSLVPHSPGFKNCESTLNRFMGVDITIDLMTSMFNCS